MNKAVFQANLAHDKMKEAWENFEKATKAVKEGTYSEAVKW